MLLIRCLLITTLLEKLTMTDEEEKILRADLQKKFDAMMLVIKQGLKPTHYDFDGKAHYE
jgi:hypothetical protein